MVRNFSAMKAIMIRMVSSNPLKTCPATRIATGEENSALLWDIRLQGDGETVLLSFPGA
jgi:hypothetical protein